MTPTGFDRSVTPNLPHIVKLEPLGDCRFFLGSAKPGAGHRDGSGREQGPKHRS